MKIKDALNTYATDGSIFQFLPLYGTATPQQMGLAYVLQHSGKKKAGALLTEFCDDDDHITTVGKQTISGIISTMFKEQWDRIYEAMTIDYDPLENYRMVESGQDVDKMEYGQETTQYQHGARSASDVYGSQSTIDTYGSQSEIDIKGAQTNTEEDEVSAFNSATYQDSNKKTITEGSREDTHSTTQYSDTHSSQAHTDGHTENAYTDSETKTAQDDKTTRDHALTRSGNIGVTTSQQMLESEYNVRAYRFYEKMFRDIDSVIALNVYEED